MLLDLNSMMKNNEAKKFILTALLFSIFEFKSNSSRARTTEQTIKDWVGKQNSYYHIKWACHD